MISNYKVAIVTNVIPQYREDMYRRLVEYYGDRLDIYCQDSVSGMNLNLVHDKFKSNTSIIKSIGLKKEKLSWQFLPIFHLYNKYDLIYFYGNPRVFSSVICSLILLLLGKKIIIWGQYHTAGANSFLERVRLLWWKRFEGVFLYTDAEAEKYKKRYPATRFVSAMNNGININDVDTAIEMYSGERFEKWQAENKLIDKFVVLSCARLDKKNKFSLFMECIPSLLVEYPALIWCIIGNGDEEKRLKELSIRLNIQSNVIFLGSEYEQEKLAPWFLTSKLLIHPGSIGLSLIHSMSYGLPVVTHNNIAMQMPEIDALEDGVNGFLFEENNYNSMSEIVRNILNNNIGVNKISENAKSIIRSKYNTKSMANNFIQLTCRVMESRQ